LKLGREGGASGRMYSPGAMGGYKRKYFQESSGKLLKSSGRYMERERKGEIKKKAGLLKFGAERERTLFPPCE